MHKKRKILIRSIILILIFLIFLFTNKEKEKIILYSWNIKDISEEKRDNLEHIINKLNINTVYQTFSSDYLEESNDEFIKYLHKKNISVYHLTGEREWGLGNDMKYIYKEIDLVYKFNKNNKNKLDGIAFDIEPYILEEWTDASLEIYVSKMKKAYKYAQEKGIYFILVIPYWYDNLNLELLEELFKDAGDEFSIMNYRIKSTIKNIENEIKFAKKYNKKINTIAEVGFKDDDKFNSFKEINADFKNIKEYYSDYNISIAYHDYSTILKELN